MLEFPGRREQKIMWGRGSRGKWSVLNQSFCMLPTTQLGTVHITHLILVTTRYLVTNQQPQVPHIWSQGIKWQGTTMPSSEVAGTIQLCPAWQMGLQNWAYLRERLTGGGEERKLKTQGQIKVGWWVGGKERGNMRKPWRTFGEGKDKIVRKEKIKCPLQVLADPPIAIV